jgi:hypothetical protein
MKANLRRVPYREAARQMAMAYEHSLLPPTWWWLMSANLVFATGVIWGCGFHPKRTLINEAT